MANIKKDFASPNGPILLLSAKGSTTASIAEANGVKDFSGNGNHGQAYGTGILVSDDNEMGVCFDCQGTNSSYLLVQHGVLDNKREFTIHFKWKSSEPSSNNWVFVASGDGNAGSRQICVAASTSYIRYSIHDNVNDIDTGTCFYDQNPFDGILHTFTYVVDFNNAIAILYVDGVKFTESVVNVASTYKITSQHFTFGNAWTAFKNAPHKGKLADIRVYPRALSAAEVKYLCNGFQPNLIMGQTIPSGAILDLSARGLTTAGIAQANGVVDRSGNGNHGQAGSGVSVINNEEKGFCFSFDRSNNTASKLTFGQNIKTSTATGLTISICFISTEINILQILFDCYSSNGNRATLTVYEDNYFGWSGCGVMDHRTPQKIEVDKWYEYTVVYGDNGTIKAYLNSELIDSTNIPDGADNPTLIGNSYIGNRFSSNNLGLKGLITNVRIYPRALTASEVQQLADASLKKISAINLGSNTIKHIYYGGNLVYAKTATYIDRYPSGTILQIAPTGTAVYYATPHAVVLIPEYGSIKKLVMFDNVNLAFKIYETDGTRRSDTTYTDFSASNRFRDGALSIVEDPDGYIYAVGVGTGWVVKYRLKSTTQNGQTTYSMEQVAETKPGSLVAAGQISYCAPRDSMIVVGWRSGGGTSIACQLSKDLSTATVIGQWSSPSIGGCFDQTGTRLYFCTYSSNKFAYMTYSSASDTALKTSYTSTTVPPNYNSESLSSNDNRYVIAATDGYMYMQMLNGSIFKYSAATESWVEKVGNIGSGASTTRCDYMGTYEYKNHSILYSKHDGGIYRLYL